MISKRRHNSTLLLLTLSLTATVASLQFTLTVPVLPELPTLLNISVSDSAWVVIATLLSSTVGTPIIARMADLYGRKRMLIVAIGLLVLGSIVAALGMTFAAILVGRVLQGFALAAVPIGVSLIHTHLPPTKANMGVALLSGTIGFGSALSLPLAGWLMSSFGLASIFWASAIGSGLCLLLVILVVPESAERLERKLAVGNTLLLVVWLTALMLLISKISDWGIASLESLSIGIIFTVTAFIWAKSSFKNPNAIIDLRQALEPTMLRINFASFLATFGMFAFNLVTIQQARAPMIDGMGLELPVLQAGLVVLPFAFAMILLTPLTGWSINRFGAKNMLILGTSIMAAGFFLRMGWNSGLASIIVASIISGVGTSFAFSAMPSLVTKAAPAAEHASANGVNSLVRSLSGAIASSAYALVLNIFPSSTDTQYLSVNGFYFTFLLSGIACLAAALIAVSINSKKLKQADL